jgi:hypothetical protein
VLTAGGAAALAGLGDGVIMKLIKSLDLLFGPEIQSCVALADFAERAERLVNKLVCANNIQINKQLKKKEEPSGSGDPPKSPKDLNLQNIFSQQGESALAEIQNFLQIELQYSIDQSIAIALADNLSRLITFDFAQSSTDWSTVAKTYSFQTCPPIISVALIASPARQDESILNVCSFRIQVVDAAS